MLFSIFARQRAWCSGVRPARLTIDHPQITVVFPRLPEGTVPSHFTVYAANRDMVQNYLAEQGIKSTTYWPRGAMVDTKGFADADYIYNHVLSIPCDRST